MRNDKQYDNVCTCDFCNTAYCLNCNKGCLCSKKSFIDLKENINSKKVFIRDGAYRELEHRANVGSIEARTLLVEASKAESEKWLKCYLMRLIKEWS